MVKARVVVGGASGAKGTGCNRLFGRVIFPMNPLPAENKEFLGCLYPSAPCGRRQVRKQPVTKWNELPASNSAHWTGQSLSGCLSPRDVFIFCALVAGFLSAVSVPVAGQDREDAPRGRIAGTIRSATTGEPLKSVVATLRAPPQRGRFSKTTTSGLEGNFAFEGLPPGKYQLTFRKTGYRTLRGAGTTFTLRENQATVNLVFALWPAGAIEGRVLDSEGEPVPDAQVRAYRVRYRETGVFLSLAGRAQSDDLGEYRIYDLAAGSYLVGLAPPSPGTPAGEYYANTAGNFYPGVPGPSQAIPLKLAWGQDLSDIDLRLAEGVTYAVIGTVWDVSIDAPCSGCVVRPTLIDGPSLVGLSNTARASREGLFILRGLNPGDYRVIARRAGREGVVSQTQVTVRDRNLEDVTLLVGQVQAISGRIVLQDPPDSLDATSWTPYLSFVPPSTSWPDGEGQIAEDLRFHIPELPAGEYLFEPGFPF